MGEIRRFLQDSLGALSENKRSSERRGEFRGSCQESTGESPSDFHLAYLNKNWEILAAISWKEFTAQGRGALITEPETGCASDADWDCMYMPLEILRLQLHLEDYIDLVRLYTPTMDLVAIFLTPPDRVSAYRGTLAPE